MTELVRGKCVPCRGGVPTLTDAEIEKLQPQVPDWNVVEVGGVRHLRREIKVKDFKTELVKPGDTIIIPRRLV